MPLRPNCDVVPREDFTTSVAKSCPGRLGEKVTLMVQSVVLSELRGQLDGEVTTKSALPVIVKAAVAAGVSPTAKCNTRVWVTELREVTVGKLWLTDTLRIPASRESEIYTFPSPSTPTPMALFGFRVASVAWQLSPTVLTWPGHPAPPETVDKVPASVRRNPVVPSTNQITSKPLSAI
jgi:hypothetical protein